MKALDGAPCLLVLDNAEESVTKHLDALPKGPQWHLLLTSRHSIGSISELELDKLEPEAALALFQSHCPDFKDDAVVLDLLEQVEYHTLTVEILAKTANRRSSSRDQLLNSLKEDWKVMVSVNRGKNKVERVMGYLTSIFKVQEKLTAEETWLLTQFTCFPNDYLSIATISELVSGYCDRAKEPATSRPHWLARLFRRSKGKSIPEFSVPNPLEALWQSKDFPGELEVILNRLVDTGWLQKGKDRRFRLHRVIGDVLWQQFAPTVEEMEGLIDLVDNLLRIDYTKDNPVDKFQWIPFGQTVLDRFLDSQANPIALLQNSLALVLSRTGDYKGAKILLEKAVAANELNYGPEHLETAVNYSNLAIRLKDLGDYAGAKELLEKAVASYERNFGTEHPTTASSYSKLAAVLQDLGDYAGAKDLSEKAVASDERMFGPEHPKMAIRYSSLATVLQDLGDYAGAKELLEKAVAAAERNFGNEHPTTASNYSNLALVLQDLGDYTGAKALLEKAVTANERNFGTEHPETARSYSNLALALTVLGDYAGAKELLEKAVAAAERIFGYEHPETAIRYSNLALVLQDLGDYPGARVLLEKAVASDERSFGIGHPSTARSYNNLAGVLRDMEEYEQALPLYEKAIAIARKVLPGGHPTTGIFENNLKFLLSKM